MRLYRALFDQGWREGVLIGGWMGILLLTSLAFQEVVDVLLIRKDVHQRTEGYLQYPATKPKNNVISGMLLGGGCLPPTSALLQADSV